jgi:predicted transcriptional regulator
MKKQDKSKQTPNKTFAPSLSKSSISSEIIALEGEMIIVNKRIEIMKEFLKDLTPQDPQYGMLRIGIEAELFEFDELKNRKLDLQQKL